MNKKIILFLYCLIFLILFIVTATTIINTDKKINEMEREKISFLNKEIKIDTAIVREDLITYGTFSKKYIDKIIERFLYVEDKYKIPIGLMHAIIRIESDYRWWLEHDIIFVNKQQARAVGLGGIVWEYWKKDLIRENIIEKRSDLFFVENNIEAIAFILRKFVNEEKSISEDSIIDRLITKYYGAFSQEYKNKLTICLSDLWLKRIVKKLKVR